MSKLFVSSIFSKNYDNHLPNSLNFTCSWLISRYVIPFT